MVGSPDRWSSGGSRGGVIVVVVMVGAHRGVKIEICVSLWLLLKGHSGEVILGVNYSIVLEKISLII